jgi:hypothetical protein
MSMIPCSFYLPFSCTGLVQIQFEALQQIRSLSQSLSPWVLDGSGLRVMSLASPLRRNFFATRAVSPPVDAEPATTIVIVAIHTGHMALYSSRRDLLRFHLGFSFGFNQTTNHASPFGTRNTNFLQTIFESEPGGFPLPATNSRASLTGRAKLKAPPEQAIARRMGGRERLRPNRCFPAAPRTKHEPPQIIRCKRRRPGRPAQAD